MTASHPRKDQARNRAALIAAGRQVFGTQGVDAPFESVAKQAGLSSASLYRHFPTRDALLIEVYRASLGEQLERHAALTSVDDPWQVLVEHLRWVFDTHFTDELALTRSLAVIPNGLDEELDTIRRSLRDAMVALVDAAKAQGRFREDRWLNDVLLFCAANEALARLGPSARPDSDRLFELLLDSISTRRRIGDGTRPPDPPTMDSVITRFMASS
ncbi:TetR/AcrR family transcriptional regulator [Klenkia brasiliensis]|uniref:TetR/AcrR family transcriptional regulator n=1 Tax=Klenkia brasiliensis TaxID=333142 RepID=UPI0013F5FE47|nr:TetR/AcrR family transcriptional regulator [Klenkia brasiliensis]